MEFILFLSVIWLLPHPLWHLELSHVLGNYWRNCWLVPEQQVLRTRLPAQGAWSNRINPVKSQHERECVWNVPSSPRILHTNTEKWTLTVNKHNLTAEQPLLSHCNTLSFLLIHDFQTPQTGGETLPPYPLQGPAAAGKAFPALLLLDPDCSRVTSLQSSASASSQSISTSVQWLLGEHCVSIGIGEPRRHFDCIIDATVNIPQGIQNKTEPHTKASRQLQLKSSESSHIWKAPARWFLEVERKQPF